ncbi:MAG: M48 family metallopeptidase [Alphaproteobacteria bacterium]|nr:M48 family metallopeptidase [Alphaproteobacteria bacterium]
MQNSIQMAEQNYRINIEGRDFPLDIKRNSKAKRCILRVNHIKQSIDLTIPKRYRTEKAVKFARSQILWIEKQIEQMPEKINFYDGITIPVAGRPTTITRAKHPQAGTKQIEDTIIISGHTEHFNRRTKDFLKKEAKRVFTNIANKMAEKMGKKIKKISVKDTHSRWGSCNSAGNISYSWRLILAPVHVMEYVIAHEVAHLAELNHSEAFWNQVGKLLPNYHKAKKWLKENGNSLHLYE